MNNDLQGVIDQVEELRAHPEFLKQHNFLTEVELLRREVYLLQEQLQNSFKRIKELNEKIYNYKSCKNDGCNAVCGKKS